MPILRRFILLLPLLLAIVPLPADAQNYQFAHYTNADGLPQQVLAIYQDSRGYLWFGTNAGAALYGGAGFRVFTTEQGLPSNRVTGIGEDARGRVLLATASGIAVYDGETMEGLEVPAGLEGRSVDAVYPDSDGRIWAATPGGLYSFAIDDPDGTSRLFPDQQARVITSDSRRRLWMGGRDGLFQLVGDRFVPRNEGIPAGVYVTAIVESNDGSLWLGTHSGLYRGDGVSFAAVNDSAVVSPRAMHVYSGTIDAEGVLWFGAWAGIIRVDGGRLSLLTEANGLPNANVLSAFGDREGNVWFGTFDGVAKLVPGPFTSYTAAHRLPGSSVLDIAEDAGGRVWIVTRDGVGVIERNGSVWMLGAIHGFPPSTWPTSVAPLADGSVLIGTGRGLFQWQQKITRHLAARDGLPVNAVTELLVRHTGEVWIGLEAGIVGWSQGALRPIPGTETLRERRIASLAEDTNGNVWIAGDPSGLFRYDDETATLAPAIEAADELSSSTVVADRQGGVWIGTNGEGVLHVAADRVRRVTAASGLASNFVPQILVDGEDRVWFYTNRGLDRMQADGTFTQFDFGDGLIDLEGAPGAAIEDSRGGLWFGTARGAVHYAPERDRIIAVHPQVRIEAATAGGRPLDVQGPDVEISSSRSNVTFDFAGLSFRDESDTAFRYRLVGLDEEWSLPTSERQISYGSLPPGPYTFEVEARNPQGLWSEVPASFRFVVRPTIYQTVWFRVAMVFAGVLAIGQIYWLRGRYVERERRRLARKVEERTRELIKETEEKKRFEDRVSFMINHDALTGLANRRLFKEQLGQAALFTGASGRLSAILYIDVDRLHRINEARGYQAGDQILRAIAQRLTQRLDLLRTSTDRLAPLETTVAKMEGDEFVALVMGCAQPAEVEAIARRLLADLARPLRHEDDDLVITASIGIVVLSGEAIDSSGRLRDAYTAMLFAKKDGGNAARFFEEHMKSRATERLSLEARLHRALEREELELQYQPILDATNGHVHSVEALLRWTTTRFGSVPPSIFIPIAEEAGLIKGISEWVLRRACAQCKGWEAAMADPPKIAVNLPALFFRQHDLVDSILETLADIGLAPHRLILELTESALLESTASVKGVLDKLHTLGITLALDDFGTGYSSLSYLNRFPLDELKIDRGFVTHLSEERESRSIVAAIIAMAHGLSMKVVAEGVESAEQLEFLREQGCDLVQGYLLCRPAPADQLEAFFAEAPQIHGVGRLPVVTDLRIERRA